MLVQEQVTSLELSKKLKELGVKQDSTWYWIPDQELDERWVVGKSEGNYLASCVIRNDVPVSYAAFSVAELGAMLVDSIQEKTQAGKVIGRLFLKISCDLPDSWFLHYLPLDVSMEGDELEDYPMFSGETEAEARGMAIAWLIENGHIVP